MKKLLVASLALLILTPVALAEDFSMDAEQLAVVLLKNTISNLEMSNKFVEILDNSGSDSVYQNLWGVIYGALAVMAVNNEVTTALLDEVSKSQELSSKVGDAINSLGENSTVVFGDVNGSKGLTLILRKESEVLQNGSYPYSDNETLSEAYARVVAEFTSRSVDFIVKLFSKIDEAWV
ncbi:MULTISPECIES: hypothetical protein [Archaeoglobus]|jgi:hypothetical protein|uniref:Uncharacterized protein AF_1118 n=3 Tax=Archaeoglobus fulgidus TaxID=2234 RepID=Y1118_ARCFU|nr:MULTISPECIES: hypothetical protein [Archaeoglobus]O29147.1 RecName: Full=Uncharacterized protein AF_1118; Flags: Precursor [Archaeoglobus fulgidus DSM 4304]AAB90141.1 predicted coding region AF_1118 [Archaeoglobus fulgidus DSM 4304]AIG97994.1 hypothetical protein AFULGI_00012150 [Archaeoglobus fulgidus DSM 8774]KUJ94107.1 MAG: hypothetical protein XD40_0701 [Archaeoglobus fulgidus]KUK07697.1 MAG: Uncharacterized protein XD48_0032 [Archaeoglobus fulgidus]MDI3497393.1 hypothetical protein [A